MTILVVEELKLIIISCNEPDLATKKLTAKVQFRLARIKINIAQIYAETRL